ncbi:MAG TPA: flagellar biosynthesis anti-sigma factor FlgM [Desulfovibrio sp.]|jgi:anti-sigma28 factor (negative regulator of flagellin synthesis)|uniref:flagellar biosynthesis anti-sigma factor FlgM n=1 Tax=Desulfovibrio TaxID=872 RepID=UPI002A3F6C3D|nr:flagellar biosynthesis anti-sigma factor FlgM [Desulfovibrio sp.]MDY0305655.1 flagellar biosynthesis anti-sigma factor FlgM [Desulfovibrionaceae bacterium]HMM39217.1 flagellar biosynthesis anti-sigma factor FlgM [Desulfovibrio sp.]
MLNTPEPGREHPDASERDAALPDREARAARLRDIKARIRAGDYTPDIKDVAYLLAAMMNPR